MRQTGWVTAPSATPPDRPAATGRAAKRLHHRAGRAPTAIIGPVPQDLDGSPALDDPTIPRPETNSTPDPGTRPGPGADGSTAPPHAAPPHAAPPDPERSDAPPGLGEQIGATRDSARRFVAAHVDLAKAEFADIADAAKRAAVLLGIAAGAAVVAGLLVTVGLPLFLGDAIFGSIGWGLLLGLLVLAAVIVASVITGLRPATRASVGRPFGLGLLVGVVVGVFLGLNLTNRGWSALADGITPSMDPAIRPLVVAVVGLAVIGAIVGLVMTIAAGGRGGAVLGGILGVAIAGALVGLLTAFAPGRRVGAALGVTIGLSTWIGAMAASVARGGFATDAIKERFWPAQTIKTTKETIEWARERMPLSRRS